MVQKTVIVASTNPCKVEACRLAFVVECSAFHGLGEGLHGRLLSVHSDGFKEWSE